MFSSIIVLVGMFGRKLVMLWLILVFMVSVGEKMFLGMFV